MQHRHCYRPTWRWQQSETESGMDCSLRAHLTEQFAPWFGPAICWTILLATSLRILPRQWIFCSKMESTSSALPCTEIGPPPGLTLPARVHMFDRHTSLHKWIHKGYVREVLVRQCLLPKAVLCCPTLSDLLVSVMDSGFQLQRWQDLCCEPPVVPCHHLYCPCRMDRLHLWKARSSQHVTDAE